MRVVAKLRTSRRWQPAMVLALVALQIHLLLVPVLHHHGGEVLPSGSAGISTGSHTPQPAQGTEARCPACKIVRHNAMRPAPTLWTPDVSFAAPLARALASSQYHSPHSATVFGRAPPLS